MYTVKCSGAGGQSFGAFIPKGLTLELVGDSNDYFGKGLSEEKLVVYPPASSLNRKKTSLSEMWHSTGLPAAKHLSTELRESSSVSEIRCCCRSGRRGGDHGCEYMTGGRVLVLGETGKNFAAGMSGGIAYVLDEDSSLYMNVNKEMVTIETITSKYDVLEVKEMLKEHVAYTNSEKGKKILRNFEEFLPKFKKIMPVDYKRMLNLIVQMEERGLSSEQAQIEAFYENAK